MIMNWRGVDGKAGALFVCLFDCLLAESGAGALDCNFLIVGRLEKTLAMWALSILPLSGRERFLLSSPKRNGPERPFSIYFFRLQLKLCVPSSDWHRLMI
jgi:hypothetical protein